MLSESEIDRLQIILNDEGLLRSVYKVLDEITEVNRPKVQADDTNSIIGEKYRAFEQAKNIINAGFIELQSYRKLKVDKVLLNRAR